MLPQEKIRTLTSRYEELQAIMAEGNLDGDKYVKFSKEYSELEPVIQIVQSYQKSVQELADLRLMMEDKSIDKDMQEMAEIEWNELKETIPHVEHQIKIMLLPKDAADEKSAILEIRAGTGGDEAAIFAGDLFRMYDRYAASKGWKVELMSESEAETGGYKEIIASVTGQGVFARLKFESGVHRVQRVPITESNGRIHTSAATVAVLPQVEEVDIEIRPEDIRIDTMRSSGAGGQHVNTTDSAVRITHIPTGIVVTSSEKSQHQNRAKAMQVLRARLFDQKQQETDNARAAERKMQVGSGDRSERIRTYNYPQGRVTDHRINLTLYKLDTVISGDSLDELIDPLIAENQMAHLASLGEE